MKVRRKLMPLLTTTLKNTIHELSQQFVLQQLNILYRKIPGIFKAGEQLI